ncbi:hypothetical protein LEL_01934 [Akanthomyces lecanii RCEF 1005]|uniref:Uncharacterized protein n=1 Tax=Akanthomyces lecanii RCEF 1005 TaxID=1081108 RepID=A0A168KWZ0_CORDF|nr:hypothetical protein LEL_01934 [Akanthomyces lecanii RCEF 1005]
MAALPIRPRPDAGTTRIVRAALISMVVYMLSIAAFVQFTQIGIIHDQRCLRFLGRIMCSLSRLFFNHLIAEAVRERATPRKNDLVLGFAGLGIALRALMLLETGRRDMREPSIWELTTQMGMWLNSSWRERFDATYANLFLTGVITLVFMHIRGDEEVRGYVQRAYELFTGFYMRLLMTPWALFINPVPPMVTFVWRRIRRSRRRA